MLLMLLWRLYYLCISRQDVLHFQPEMPNISKGFVISLNVWPMAPIKSGGLSLFCLRFFLGCLLSRFILRGFLLGGCVQGGWVAGDGVWGGPVLGVGGDFSAVSVFLDFVVLVGFIRSLIVLLSFAGQCWSISPLRTPQDGSCGKFKPVKCGSSVLL